MSTKYHNTWQLCHKLNYFFILSKILKIFNHVFEISKNFNCSNLGIKPWLNTNTKPLGPFRANHHKNNKDRRGCLALEKHCLL